jgi:hypothetical protein
MDFKTALLGEIAQLRYFALSLAHTPDRNRADRPYLKVPARKPMRAMPVHSIIGRIATPSVVSSAVHGRINSWVWAWA